MCKDKIQLANSDKASLRVILISVGALLWIAGILKYGFDSH